MKRYDFGEVYKNGECYCEERQTDRGRYVLYQDHLEEIKILEEKIIKAGNERDEALNKAGG